MTLAACCLSLAASFNPEAWSLKLLTIDRDLRAKALPGVTHDLELSCDGLQLARASVTNVYFELFHII